MPSSLARAKIGACHSQGVWAFSYSVQRSTCPQAVRVLDEELVFGQVQGHGVGGVGLQLQGMSAGPGGGFDDLQPPGDWLWLPLISAMMNGGASAPMLRWPILKLVIVVILQ